MILEGEIKDAKMSSFSSDFQTLSKLNFLCIFAMNYLWDLRKQKERVVIFDNSISGKLVVSRAVPHYPPSLDFFVFDFRFKDWKTP